MADQQDTSAPVFFQPLPEHDNLNTAYFLAKIADRITISEHGCWAWGGNRVKSGYGRVDFGGRKYILHRIIYKLCVGELATRVQACHKCDNPICCNPSHLFAGTASDNQRDSVAKGRNRTPRLNGSAHPGAKITEDDVREIRRRAAEGPLGTKKALAEEYGVSQACISEIVNGKKWGHING